MNTLLIAFLRACFLAVASAQCGCNPMVYYPPKKDENGLFEGDIRLTEDQEKVFTSGFRNQIPNLNLRWPGGIIPYQISDSRLNGYNIPGALAAFQQRLGNCIQFRPRNNQDQSYINVVYENGCWSFIGRLGGVQKLSLGPGCNGQQVIHHEFMHAIGFHHEQVRPDRNNHVIINWGNIQNSQCHNFQTYGVNPPFPYDFGSVMHYESNAFSCNGRYTMTNRNGGYIGSSQVSNNDVAKIRRLYGCG